MQDVAFRRRRKVSDSDGFVGLKKVEMTRLVVKRDMGREVRKKMIGLMVMSQNLTVQNDDGTFRKTRPAAELSERRA